MRKYLPVVLFLAVAVASIVMAGTAYFAGEQSGRFKFEATADDALARIDARIDQHMALLRAALGFMQATDGSADAERFSAFVETLELEKRFAGIRGIGYARLVPVADEATAAADLAAQHGPATAIWPATTDQDWRTPVMMLSPIDDRNRQALGFDMFSEPARRAAMQEAMASGEARATLPLSLVPPAEAGVQGFLVYLPFFPKADAGGVVLSEGGLVPAGFLYASFRISDLFAAALGKAHSLPIHYDVFDGTPEQGHPVYSSETPASPAYDGEYVVGRELNVAGRQWIVRFQPSDAFEKPISQAVAFALATIGLLLAIAAGLLSRSQAQAYDAARKLQQSAEKSLQDKDMMLREMSHRIKNSIAKVMAIARHTANSANTLDEFSSSFAARLQAMAASQDMLTRSSWAKADLEELLRIELGQVFGDLPAGILSGPPVVLSEAQTQALGLTFHELATNALKYGAAGQSVDALRVDWSTDSARRWLRIRWTERGSPVSSKEPGHIGFGTRLIDMNIKQELGGRLDRSFSADGLAVTIDIPLTPANARR